MTDAQKRQYVSNLYSGPKWKKRVEKMPDGQVLAIYLDHVRDGTKPEHDEDSLHILEPVIQPLADETIIGTGRTPSAPHANEDEFPIY